MTRRTGVRTITLSEAERRLRAARAGNWDAYIHLGRLRVIAHPSAQGWHEALSLAVAPAAGETAMPQRLALREESARQLCHHLGVPPNFAATLPAEVAANLLNRALYEGADKLALLRCKRTPGGSTLRAILKPSYPRLTDLEVVSAVRASPTGTELRVSHISILEDVLSLRVVFPEGHDLGRPRRPDIHLMGIDVTNTETGGQSRLAVRFLCHRLVCSNGLTMPVHFSRLDARHARFDGDALRDELTTALAWCSDRAPRMIHSLMEARQISISSPEEELDALFRRYRLGGTRGRIGQRMMNELQRGVGLFGCSLFDFIQAVTLVSQTLAPLQRLRFEDAVGEMLVQRTEAMRN